MFVTIQRGNIRPLKKEMNKAVTERREKFTRFWWESPREGDHLEDQGVGGKMGSECILGRLALGVWIGFGWLRTGIGGGAVVSAVMNLRVLAPRS
jgi:hypothetical protein